MHFYTFIMNYNSLKCENIYLYIKYLIYHDICEALFEIFYLLKQLFILK